MGDNVEFRIVEVFHEGKWERTKLQNIVQGEVFRMFERTGEPVLTNSGRHETIATSNPYFGPHGPNGINVWTIEAED